MFVMLLGLIRSARSCCSCSSVWRVRTAPTRLGATSKAPGSWVSGKRWADPGLAGAARIV